jgi:hypothetical protein
VPETTENRLSPRHRGGEAEAAAALLSTTELGFPHLGLTRSAAAIDTADRRAPRPRGGGRGEGPKKSVGTENEHRGWRMSVTGG